MDYSMQHLKRLEIPGAQPVTDLVQIKRLLQHFQKRHTEAEARHLLSQVELSSTTLQSIPRPALGTLVYDDGHFKWDKPVRKQADLEIWLADSASRWSEYWFQVQVPGAAPVTIAAKLPVYSQGKGARNEDMIWHEAEVDPSSSDYQQFLLLRQGFVERIKQLVLNQIKVQAHN
jgi:hypothetical protein